MKWKLAAAYLVDRLKEPSSWAGIGLFALGAGLKIDPAMMGYITQAGLGLAGLAAILLKENA